MVYSHGSPLHSGRKKLLLIVSREKCSKPEDFGKRELRQGKERAGVLLGDSCVCSIEKGSRPAW